MWMHLARTVTHSTVRECQQRMSAVEFGYWQALYRIAPWGDEWNQTRAIAASNIAPWNKRIRLDGFFPKHQAPKTDGEMESALNVFAARHNAKLRRNRGR